MTAYRDRVSERVRAIPPISAITIKLIELIAREDYETEQLVRLIETDVTLAGRCLQRVNASSLGLRTPVNRIRRAVVLLGARAVADLALEAGLSRTIRQNLGGYQVDGEQMWRHCLLTAIASRRIAQTLMGNNDADLAYAAGLLHDVGKIVVSDFLIEDKRFLESLKGPPESFLDAEQRRFGTDHARAGMAASELWRLPEAIQTVIRYHHHPSKAPEPFRELVVCVHLGDIFAMMAGDGTGIDSLSYAMDPLAGQYLRKQGSNVFQRLILAVNEEYRSALGFSDGVAADV
jgi:putative nucleotidyltransferase with HDIG domain